MPKSKSRKRKSPKRVLALPDLSWRNRALGSVMTPDSVGLSWAII